MKFAWKAKMVRSCVYLLHTVDFAALRERREREGERELGVEDKERVWEGRRSWGIQIMF